MGSWIHITSSRLALLLYDCPFLNFPLELWSAFYFLQLDKIHKQRFFLHFITMNTEWRQRRNLSDGVSTVSKEALYVFNLALYVFNLVLSCHQFFSKSCCFIQTIVPFSPDISRFTQVVLPHYLQDNCLTFLLSSTTRLASSNDVICNILLHCSI
jgi:hypothetical protein